MVHPPSRKRRIRMPIGQVLTWAAKMARSEVRSRATLEQSCDEDIAVIGDESQLGQVFLNLVLNAAQAIQPGAASENSIRLSARREGDRVRVEVPTPARASPSRT